MKAFPVTHKCTRRVATTWRRALYALLLSWVAWTPAAAQRINEIQVSTVGTDWEFVEIFSQPPMSLVGLTLIEIEGDVGSPIGRVDAAIALTGSTNASGYYLLMSPTGAATYGIVGDQAIADNTLENSTATYLLVENWSGAVGNDLDTNDDGVFDSTPWTAILDSVGLRDAGVGDFVYSVNDLGPDGANLPSGAERVPNGGPWSPTFLNFNVADGTPGRSNSAVINEIEVSTTGTDWEFVEFFHTPSTSLAGLTLIEIEGDVGSPIGRVDAAIALTGSTSATGFYLLISPAGATAYAVVGDQSMPDNTLENSTATYLLVSGWSGAVGNDLDTNDDGLFDSTPWTSVLDGVGLRDAGVGDLVYSANDLGPDGANLPSGAERLPDGGPWSLVFLNFTTPDGTPGATNGIPPPPAATPIHDVQGSGATSPLDGQTVTVEGVVVGDYQTQGSGQLRGFFLEEEDTDHDADPATSEGIFVFCSSCPTAVAEGERVRVTGTVSEFFNMTQITASTAPAVVVVEAGNHLAEVTPALLDLPIVAPTTVDEYYEAREGMRVTFVDSLTVSEYFNLFRYGTVTLYEGGRPFQFAAQSTPSVAGYAAHLDALARRVVLLDDENNTQNWPLVAADGSQFVYHPRANGGLSVGTQGTDFFRGGDLVTGLTGVLHYSFSGQSGTDAWRIRPTAANPVAVTVANPRPPAAPPVPGPIRAASFNLLSYFTTIDTGADVCGPAANVECRGADSVAELARQRERHSVLLCGLDADVVGLAELENTTSPGAIADLVGAVNARCGGADPYAYVDTGGTLGTDAIRVGLIYRSATLAPVGPPLVDLDPAHDRPPTAQVFDVIDPANPAFGQRFTAIAVHFKSKGCGGATGLDLDQNDGQGCYNARRTAQATRLLAWIGATVLPTAGDPDLLLLGDFNFYAQEDPAGVLSGGGYVDLAALFGGPDVYSYLFDGQLGRFDYAWASASLAADSVGAGVWHVDADEVPLFDYNDEVRDASEASFDEKPDGSALATPRVLFQPASPFRASDHDPVLAGLFRVADLSVTKSDAPDPVIAGTNLVYTVTVANAGPDAATNAAWSDTLPAGTTFVSLSAPAGWSCSTPAVGAGGTVSCSIASFGAGSAVFTLAVEVDATYGAGVLLSNDATVTSDTSDGNLANNLSTATTTVLSPATVTATKAVAGAFVPGSLVIYTVVLTNAGPATQLDNPGDEFVDVLPAGLTLVSASADSGVAFADLGTNTATWNGSIPPGGTVTIVVEATIDYGVADGTVISNQGSALFDANGDGTNEAVSPTDDPATGTVDDPTEFVVAAPAIQEIPTLDAAGLALLALLLAGFAALRLRRAPR